MTNLQIHVFKLPLQSRIVLIETCISTQLKLIVNIGLSVTFKLKFLSYQTTLAQVLSQFSQKKIVMFLINSLMSKLFSVNLSRIVIKILDWTQIQMYVFRKKIRGTVQMSLKSRLITQREMRQIQGGLDWLRTDMEEPSSCLLSCLAVSFTFF